MTSWEISNAKFKLSSLNDYIKSYDLSDDILIEHIKHIREKIDELEKQIKIFRPKYNKYFDKIKVIDILSRRTTEELYKSMKNIYELTNPYYFDDKRHSHTIDKCCEPNCPGSEYMGSM